MSKFRLMALVGLMAAALTPLYGCGAECAEGTTDKDGQCVVAAKGCADGTTLQNGECLLDDTGCGEGTMFAEGKCVPAEGTCDGNTSFDGATGTCIPNSDIICGAGTEAGDDGYCVPDAEACSDKTVFEDGRCVIAAASCGEGTELDPNTGECVLAEAGCSTGLAFDAESGTCIPTEEICDTGTVFDADSGLCLADSCSYGDVVVDGVCMTPAEDLARNPDLTETENNDPALGGSAETLFVNAVDADPYVFAGAIGEPSDLDGDGEVDQDVDVFEFEAEAGEWFEITVQSIGLQAPAFVVQGPDGYTRYSAIGVAQDAARQIVVPADGTYTVTVLPSLVLQSRGEINRIGGADWTYVGTLKAIAQPAGTDVDLSAGSAQFSGDYIDLTDNLFHVNGLQPGDIVTLRLDTSGADTHGIIQVRDATGVLTHSEDAKNRGTIEFVAAGSSAAVLLDWTQIFGPATDFELTASITGAEKSTTMPPGATESFQVTAQIDDQIMATQSNPQSATLNVTIVEDATATELDSDATLGSGDTLQPLVATPGTYTVTFTNDGSTNVDATMTAKLIPPFRLGQIDPGMSVSTGTFEQKDNAKTFVTFSVGAGQMIEIYHDNDQSEEHNFELYDDTGVEVEYNSYFYPYSDSFAPEFMYWYVPQGGSFRLEVEARSDVTNEIIYVNSPIPNAVNLATAGTVESRSGGAMREERRQWYLVDIGEEGKLQVSGQSDNGEDIDLYVYDLAMDQKFSVTDSGGLDDRRTMAVGQYLMAIEPDNDIGSFDVTFDLQAPPPPPQFLSVVNASLPDNDTTGITDTLAVTGCATISAVEVYVKFTHDDTGDPAFTLTSPTGTSVVLRETDAGGSDGTTMVVDEWYPTYNTPVDSLSVLNGETGNGDWSLKASDEYWGDYGTLDEWGLNLTCQ